MGKEDAFHEVKREAALATALSLYPESVFARSLALAAARKITVTKDITSDVQAYIVANLIADGRDAREASAVEQAARARVEGELAGVLEALMQAERRAEVAERCVPELLQRY